MRKLAATAGCIGALVLMVAGPERAAADPTQASSLAGNAPIVTAPIAAVGGVSASTVSTTPRAAAALTSTSPRLTFTAPEASAGGSRCAPGTVEVEGDYCPNVEQKCLRWLDPETQMRCAEFAPTATCVGKTIRKHFCIDQYEYPNRVGERPIIMKTWYEARDACQAQGKRLCGDSEWTLACEGQERLSYPYGYERNAEACNIDKPHPDVNEAAIANPKTRDAEVTRLWQGEVSGARDACVSPFGVHDMTGNVDEWVVNEKGTPFKSGLKGGYWGPVRTRCRPMTTVHNEDFQFYQIGFRCCSEPGAAGAIPGTEPGAPARPAAAPPSPPAPVLGS
jgi:sulfatase modifying factor 1